jgi:hypothetical protein
MSADDFSLPDDMDLLKSLVRAMAQKTAALEDENAALKARSTDADRVPTNGVRAPTPGEVRD